MRHCTNLWYTYTWWIFLTILYINMEAGMLTGDSTVCGSQWTKITHYSIIFTRTKLMVNLAWQWPSDIHRWLVQFLWLKAAHWATSFLHPLTDVYPMPAVLWHCWCGQQEEHLARKNFSDEVLMWLRLEWSANNLHIVQLMSLPSHHLCFSKTQNGLSFWYQLTWVVLHKWL